MKLYIVKRPIVFSPPFKMLPGNVFEPPPPNRLQEMKPSLAQSLSPKVPIELKIRC